MGKPRILLEDFLLLFILQAIVAALAFRPFLSGAAYFAFFDIGSDSLTGAVPATIHLAREIGYGWPAGWSFNFGLGNSNSGFPNIHTLLGALGGPESVLPMRIWWYLFRLALAGAGFYLLLRASGCRRTASIVMGLSYSFCGFATVDGQWDVMSWELVHYPFVLAGIVLFLKHGKLLPLPIFVALAVFGGAFIFSLGLFIAYASIGHLLISGSPKNDLHRWVYGVFPLSLLGLALAAPAVFHTVIQILDNPRATGEQGLMSSLIPLALGFNDGEVMRAQIGGFFHKDIFGIGDNYRGWFNYLEGPMFYVGMLPLILIPQLWNDVAKRKQLIVTAVLIGAFLIFPAIRMLTYGLSLPYFRTNNLWISMLLLFMAAQALDHFISTKLDRIKLMASTFAIASILIALWIGSPAEVINANHVVKMLLLLAISGAVVWAVDVLPKHSRVNFILLAGLVALGAAWIAYPSVNYRKIVNEKGPSYADGTTEIVRSIREMDKEPFYRIEKNFQTFSLNDALAQNYHGVKSYDIHGKAVVNLFIQSKIIPQSSQNSALNYTNWLPGFGDRFALHTLAGVKYLLSRVPIGWPGYLAVPSGNRIYVYQNTLALPLGVLYDKQALYSDMKALSPVAQDLAMLHAAIVDAPVKNTAYFNPNALDMQTGDVINRVYVEPASRLQKRGMRIDSFAQNRIAGSITTDVSGILAFSIPDIPGWSVDVDGRDVPTFRVNHGFFGIALAPGEHLVTLQYRPPGLISGLIVMVFGVLLLAGFELRRKRRKESS